MMQLQKRDEERTERKKKICRHFLPVFSAVAVAPRKSLAC